MAKTHSTAAALGFFALTALSFPASLVAPAMAQDLAAYQAADAAAVEAWQAMPLSVRNAGFVAEDAGGYGLNVARESSEFQLGEPILVYAEPMGYAWDEGAEGGYTFGLSIDLVLYDGEGEELARQDEFQRASLTSNQRNREFFITLTLNLDNAPAGDYRLEYVVNDLFAEQSATVSLPFTLVEAGE
ncbi:hypothetical protein [Pararhodobacter oceanensis]|uniref:hypothetical protein n=1 Tax=Pararhodobacter oceanensis TaxID=2172121 RepID=UPI003A8D5503